MPPVSPVQSSPPSAATGRLWPALTSLFFLVLGARFWLIWNYGSAMPYWDQWPGEGWLLLKPWQEGKLTWAAMVAPHLEHRIFFTRALVLGLFQVNGQWDAQLEMAANAMLYSGLITTVAWVLARALPVDGGWRAGVVLTLGLLFSLPFSWENTLGGFQSQFYFLLGFSLLTLWGLGTSRPFSSAWWAGALAAVAACFSMGSGFFAAAVVLGWMLVRQFFGPGDDDHRATRFGNLATVLSCAGVVVVGWSLRHEVPEHAVLKSHSLAGWLFALLRFLAWPNAARLGWCVTLQLPLALLAVDYFFQPQATVPNPRRRVVVERTLLLGGWCLLQVAALSFVRGAVDFVTPRYTDLLAMGIFANGLAAGLLAAQAATVQRSSWRRTLVLGAATGWLVACAVGFTSRTVTDFRVELPTKRDQMRIEEDHVRAFVLTGDPEALRVDLQLDLPYPSAENLAEYLNDKSLRRALPAIVRAPLTLEPLAAAAATADGFTPGGLPPELNSAATPSDPPAWGSYGAHGAAEQGALQARLRLPAAATWLPYWQWQFAGDLDGDEAALALRLGTMAEGTAWRALHPSRVAGRHWRAEYFNAPAPAAGEEWRVEAADRSATGWFAFRAPVEVGRWSYWAGWLLRRGGWIFTAGVAGLFGSLMPWPRRSRRLALLFP